MRRAAIFAALWIACSAVEVNAQCQTGNASSAPIDVTASDVSVKWRYSQSLKFVHRPPYCTASQVQRRALIEAGNLHYLPLARRFCQSLTTCADNMNSIIGGMNELMTELLVENSIRELGPEEAPYNEPGPGFWQFRDTIYDWSRMLDNLNKIRNAALEQQGTECASKNPSADILELLDLTIQGGKCVKRPPFVHPVPAPFDTARSNAGTLSRLIARPALLPGQITLLDETHHAHAASTVARCNGTPSTPGAVQAAHAAFEASAVDEDQHSLFRMPYFTPAWDPAWNQTDQCTIAQAQDDAHLEWMDAVADNRMDLAWRSGLAHGIMHRRAADQDTRLKYRRINGLASVNGLAAFPDCLAPIETCPNDPQ